jgi:hypothetical protein
MAESLINFVGDEVKSLVTSTPASISIAEDVAEELRLLGEF